jgi:hypothetical protein
LERKSKVKMRSRSEEQKNMTEDKEQRSLIPPHASTNFQRQNTQIIQKKKRNAIELLR